MTTNERTEWKSSLLYPPTYTQHVMYATYIHAWASMPWCIRLPSQLNHCLSLSQRSYGFEWMTNCSMCPCTRSLKTLRERSTRQISPPWPRPPPRMVPKSTSFPSQRSPSLSPNSLADPVRYYLTLYTYIIDKKMIFICFHYFFPPFSLHSVLLIFTH